MNYDEAIAFIHSIEWRGSRPGLSRITELLSLLGNPEKNFKSVHVAGTNGKGSFCSMLESVLRKSGYKTGLFTSPYLEVFEERICINGLPIDRNELAEIVTYVSKFSSKMKDQPTEFELITAIGFEYFKRQKVDIAIVECGMGGRLDSTNVISSPLLSVITGISLDHVAFLGNTITEIAKEKAGIIKRGCPVIFGGSDEEAANIIKLKSKEMGCNYIQKDNSLISNETFKLDGTDFNYKNIKNIHIPLLGIYQPKNAATVIEAITQLNKLGFNISEESLKSGLASVKWKGRFEILNESPLIIFDGGHNDEGITAATDTVKLYFGNKKIIIITGVMKDKDYHKISLKISTIANKIYTVTPDNPRSLKASDYAKEFDNLGVEAFPCSNFDEAVKSAFNSALIENTPILCIGSLYSYASLKKAILKLNEYN